MKPEHPFVRKHLDEENKKVDSFTVRLNKEERREFNDVKRLIEQTKDSTAIKQLSAIGAKVIQRPETTEIVGIVLGNKRKNQRLGIVDFD